MQIEQGRPKHRWLFYLLGGIGFLLSALLIVAAICFRKEIQSAQGYGYTGVFIIGVLCGISVIPTPTQLLIFTIGAVLNPLYVGLVAGFGAAIGGITVYLTGAGVWKIWSELRPSRQSFQSQPGSDENVTKQGKPRLWSKVQTFYNRLVNQLGRKGGSWFIFISSAMLISPFYFTGLAAGSLHLGLLRFFLLSWAGKTVRYLIIAFAGYGGLHFLLKWIGG